MAETTKIEWCDCTFNPWVGCTKLSAACDHCYAEGWAKRAGNPELWTGERRRTTASNWQQPRKWNARAARAGVRLKVFCASLADVFDNQADPAWRADLWQLIAETPNLDWLLLTKRPQNIKKMLPDSWGAGWSHVWLGTTVENQEEADRRIPHLLSVPAAVRFLSVEPLLGPVDLVQYDAKRGVLTEALTGHSQDGVVDAGNRFVGIDSRYFFDGPKLHWVIVGGESGPQARDNDFLTNARSILAQCRAAGVPFFGKQNVKKAPLPDDLMIREFPVAAQRG